LSDAPAIRFESVVKTYRVDDTAGLGLKHRLLHLAQYLRDRRRRRAFTALDGVSLEVRRGECFGVIGRNGSGKSTTLGLMAGVYRPTSGAVRVRGRVSPLLELGAGFHPDLSGEENLLLNGVLLGLTRQQVLAKRDAIVDFSELGEFIRRPLRTYSSGMVARLGFSVVVHLDPEILLIDEVLAVGDASFVPKCLDKINEFRRHNKTIIFVSHDLATVERICDEVIWLKKGLVEMRGYPKRVVDAYLEYVGKKDVDKYQRQHDREAKSVQDEQRENDGLQNPEKRWGSREIEISNVKMFDGAGKEKYVFKADEPMAVAFDVNAAASEKDFVFGIAVYNSEGILCYGSNTVLDDLSSKSISGRGKVRLAIPALSLISGTYFLDVAVHKFDGYPFDYHHLLYTFRVTSSHRDVGIARIAHRWEFSENIRLEKNENP